MKNTQTETFIITEEMMEDAQANHDLAERFMAKATELGKEDAGFDELLEILRDML